MFGIPPVYQTNINISYDYIDSFGYYMYLEYLEEVMQSPYMTAAIGAALLGLGFYVGSFLEVGAVELNSTLDLAMFLDTIGYFGLSAAATYLLSLSFENI